jgi:hypothetical protein
VSGFYLRYAAGTAEADRFPRIRYPWHENTTRERVEQMRAAMPDPDRFEIVEVDE